MFIKNWSKRGKNGNFIQKMGGERESERPSNVLCKFFVTPKVVTYNNGGHFGY